MKDASVVQIVVDCSPTKLNLQTTLEDKILWKVSAIIVFTQPIYL
jgi:hypothetical protein